MKPVKKWYWTKSRKTQYLYWKILLGGVMLSSALIGGLTVHTGKHILKYGLIEPVKAQTETDLKQTETVEDMIHRLADEVNFQWPDYLVRLAKCESGLNPLVKNERNNYPINSTDRGLFQINNYWHYEISDAEAFDAEFAINWTMERINAGYQNEWVCNNIILNQ